MDNARLQELKEKIADLKLRWPAHSVSPAMFQELENLEEELAEELEKARKDEDGV